MPVATEPCPWDVDYGACPPPKPYEDLEGAQKALYEQMASTLLWHWTGEQFGVCPAVVHPAVDGCARGWTTYRAGMPFRLQGTPEPGLPSPGCDCHDGDHLATVVIPGPVVSILSVTLEGEVLDPAAYRVSGSRTLVRVDGGDWPAHPGADWEIQYERGVPVPAGGRLAAAILAVELWKAACRDKSCSLPQRVQSVTRQGVSVAVLDEFADLDQGRTGIWLVDSWVASIRKPRRPTRVYSPADLATTIPNRTRGVSR